MNKNRFRALFRNEKGAIDLASIMVGIIVIGLIGGVIATTVFVVIPWAQDRAAKQQVDSIVSAQSAYRGLSSGASPAIPAGLPANSYADSTDLAKAQLLQEGKTYCTTRTGEGNGFLAVAKSGSGKFFAAMDSRTQPYEIDAKEITSGCDFPDVDTTPTLTKFTYKCDVDTTVYPPFRGDVKGEGTWEGGGAISSGMSKALKAGVEYHFTFDGTYTGFGSNSASQTNYCLRSVDHWGADTGVKDVAYAFYNAKNLTDVPANIPSSITNMEGMFIYNSIVNDPDISRWDVSNVTNMKKAFNGANLFNQPLDGWDVSKVTNMEQMFYQATQFNQPLNTWNMSRVEDVSDMFYSSSFDQPLNEWDVSNVVDMSYMFDSTPFNRPIEMWDISNVENITGVFRYADKFNQPLNGWGKYTPNLTDMSGMFYGARNFNQPLDGWDVSNVTNMKNMFNTSEAFNQNINNWNVSNVTDMSGMFNLAQRFNQPLDKWNVSNVTNMSYIFATAGSFKQDLNMWDVSNVTNMSYMFYNNSGFNQPLNKWNVAKVTNMDYMFNNFAFKQDISGWNTVSVKSAVGFAPASFPDAFMPKRTSK